MINNYKDYFISYTEIPYFEPGILYKVATNDYVFDKTTNPFLDGEQIENTGIILRDLVEDELFLQSAIYDEFLLLNEIQTTE